jgi:hypothetical protein
MFDSVNLVLPKHDHYYQAGDLGKVGVGKHKGDTDNYSCATKTQPIRFITTPMITDAKKLCGINLLLTSPVNVRYRIYVNGVMKHDYWDVQLFREVTPGDSTGKGLQIIGYEGVYDANNSYWAQTCVAPGTYYLLLPGCGQVNAFVYPEIELIEARGDFCGRPVTASLNGPGSVSASVLVNCHTIGTDYGEFGPNLTCPKALKLPITNPVGSAWILVEQIL